MTDRDDSLVCFSTWMHFSIIKYQMCVGKGLLREWATTSLILHGLAGFYQYIMSESSVIVMVYDK